MYIFLYVAFCFYNIIHRILFSSLIDYSIIHFHHQIISHELIEIYLSTFFLTKNHVFFE